VYGQPYARKKVVQEYIVVFLTVQPVLRAKKGTSGTDGQTTHGSLQKAYHAIRHLWTQEKGHRLNPIGVFRTPNELKLPCATRLLNGVFAETDYAAGPITHVLHEHLANVHVLRTKANLENYVERAFKSNLMNISTEAYFGSVYACWSEAMCEGRGEHNRCAAVMNGLIAGNVVARGVSCTVCACSMCAWSW
jgi:hypothetical protein